MRRGDQRDRVLLEQIFVERADGSVEILRRLQNDRPSVGAQLGLLSFYTSICALRVPCGVEDAIWRLFCQFPYCIKTVLRDDQVRGNDPSIGE